MNRTVAKALFHTIEYIRGEHVHLYLNQLEKNQYLDSHEIRQLQNNKLQKLLSNTLQHNDFYKEKYKGRDVFGAFETLPVLTKDELRDNYQEIVSKNRSNRLDLVETSGSTGLPIQFYRDRTTFGYTLAALYRAHRWWNLDIGHKEAMLWGVPVSVKGKIRAKIKDKLLNRFRENEYNITPTTFKLFYSRIMKEKPDYLFGYSSMVYEFSIFLKQNGLKIQNGTLKAVICTAEKLHDYQKNIIESTLSCKTVSEYGATEAGIISYECPEGSNHISDDTVYLEIVDDNNIPVPDGKPGRVLITVLHSYSSPIIRYDIGDIAIKTNTQCSCGVNLSTLGSIEGRTCDVVIGPNYEVYHSIIFYYIIKNLTLKYGGIKQFKVHQYKIDELEIKIVKENEFKSEADTFIRAQIREKFGNAMKLNINYVDCIERNISGKLRDFETDLDTSKILTSIYGNNTYKYIDLMN